MTQIYKCRVRYVEGEQYKPANDYLVCPHLAPEGDERVYEDGPDGWNIGIMLVNDPSWTNNYQVRYCQACRDVYEAEDDRAQAARNAERRGYLMGLKHGYVQGKAVALPKEQRCGIDAAVQLYKEAHRFVDRNGDEFYRAYVDCELNPDPPSSQNPSPQQNPGAICSEVAPN